MFRRNLSYSVRIIFHNFRDHSYNVRNSSHNVRNRSRRVRYRAHHARNRSCIARKRTHIVHNCLHNAKKMPQSFRSEIHRFFNAFVSKSRWRHRKFGKSRKLDKF